MDKSLAEKRQFWSGSLSGVPAFNRIIELQKEMDNRFAELAPSEYSFAKEIQPFTYESPNGYAPFYMYRLKTPDLGDIVCMAADSQFPCIDNYDLTRLKAHKDSKYRVEPSRSTDAVINLDGVSLEYALRNTRAKRSLKHMDSLIFEKASHRSAAFTVMELGRVYLSNLRHFINQELGEGSFEVLDYGQYLTQYKDEKPKSWVNYVYLMYEQMEVMRSYYSPFLTVAVREKSSGGLLAVSLFDRSNVEMYWSNTWINRDDSRHKDLAVGNCALLHAIKEAKLGGMLRFNMGLGHFEYKFTDWKCEPRLRAGVVEIKEEQ